MLQGVRECNKRMMEGAKSGVLEGAIRGCYRGVS